MIKDKEKELETYLAEEEIAEKHIEVLKSHLDKANVLGFAQIQINNEAWGSNEVKLELQRIGIEPLEIICYESEKAEDVPDDWFEDYTMQFVFIGLCKNYEDIKQKEKRYRPSYILEYHLI